MTKLNLDQAVFFFRSAKETNAWTIRDSFEGTQVFGGIGSGKSSGSGQLLAMKYLEAGYGGLVLTVKPDEKNNWVEYCGMAYREDDLIILEPNGEHRFNFLDYISKSNNGKDAITENIVEVLKTVIRAVTSQESSGKEDQFWQSALDLLIFNVIDLCRLAYNTVSIELIYDIVQTLPKAGQNIKPEEGEEPSAFYVAYSKVLNEVMACVNKWEKSLPEDYLTHLKNTNTYSEILYKAYPNTRLFKSLDQFFMDTYNNLSSKTRSIVDFTFSAFLFRLLKDPIYSLFCNGNSTVTPEDCMKGKIIILNLPTKELHQAGASCQIIFKFIWQKTMEKRLINNDTIPVFLWADEAQHFIHEYDADYQATARSSRIATVYLTQNIANYYMAMGGDKAEHRVKSFLGTLGTKIFHANASIETNNYASELIGDTFYEETNGTISYGEKYSQSRGVGLKLARIIRPEEFVRLLTGGPKNDHYVEGIVHKQGNAIFRGVNHVKMIFDQAYIPEISKPIKLIETKKLIGTIK